MDKKDNKIIVKGARTHNLKNIDVEMPRNKMIAITGLSGSGKSSLAFDTIFAEGQRRYVESLSAYARQFLKQMGKPDVDEIEGLSPAISIDQKSRSKNPRSTVATITEIYDYLRVLYARIGKPHCLLCRSEIEKLSPEQIKNFVLDKVDELTSAPRINTDKKTDQHGSRATRSVLGVTWNDARIQLFSPVVRGRKGEYYQLLYDLLGKGFSHVRVDGKIKSLRDRISLSKNKKHDIDVLVDEFAVHEFSDDKEGTEMRLVEAIEMAVNESNGLVKVLINTDTELINIGKNPRLPAEVSAQAGKSVKNQSGSVGQEILFSTKFSCPKDGFSFPEIEPRLFSFNSPYGACEACNGLGIKAFWDKTTCPECSGARLRPEALHVFLSSRSLLDSRQGVSLTNIVELTQLSIKEAHEFIKNLELSRQEREIAGVVLNEIENRLKFLLDVGLDYITLDRRANTLSGGEAQRIRLASQLGSRLVGALYVLDEPTIGLHQRDNEKLISTLKDLRSLGNTIIVVEHDEDTIYSSDYIVDIGPGAGVHGGNVIVSDELEKLLTAKKNGSKSRTLSYLREEEKIEIPEKRRDKNKGALKITGGKIFNIKNLNTEVPLGRLVCVSGVSGSGKSSFLYEILNKNLRARFDRKYRSANVYNCKNFSGTEYLNRAILIDQSPIGRTPRSNVATYTGAFTHIRDLFAETEEARIRGWKPSRFSFNVKSQKGGGRCEACQGNGMVAVEMHFLPTVYVTCDVCRGKRFEKETLKVKFKGSLSASGGKNIHDVLKMTVEEAFSFFEEIPAIYDRLKTLMDVGLGYIELGQPATTLSGGEAQRVKISSELYRPHLEKTVYLLDEPTIGLHYDDVKNLIDVLNRLVGKGNTVIVIEHNMDIIKNADYILDFGPEGGDSGGKIVAKGTPEEVANNSKSHTGRYLKKVFRKSRSK